MLKKFLVNLPLLVVFSLSACSSSAVMNPTLSSTELPATATVDGTSAAAKVETMSVEMPTTVPTLPETTGAVACKVVDTLLPVLPTDRKPNVPPIDEKTDWVIGPADAQVSIIEYSDYECPYCEQISSEVSVFLIDQGDHVRFAYRHFPLPQHTLALLASQASEAAGLQGKFWEMHDFLFANQNWNEWTLKSLSEFSTYLTDKAAPTIQGLDVNKFKQDLTSQIVVDRVKAAAESAGTLEKDPKNGIQGTPTFFVFAKDQVYNAPASITLSENIINLVKLDDQRFKECPPMQIDSQKQYTTTLKTKKGDIVIKLYADKSPAAVNSFIYLAKKGYYAGITFHRVVPGFIAQSGDPSNSGLGGPGYLLGTEISNDLTFDREGLVGMIRDQEPDTNNSQFFITLAPLPALNNRYTIFGEVTQGMDVVNNLTPRNTNNDDTDPLPGDEIISVTIEEK